MSKLRHPALAEALTERELEVLRLLVTDHLSNREIGERLFLTTGTVKWYMQQIFGKLGVKNRREAVKRVHDLNLLEMQKPAPAEFKIETNLPEPLTAFVGRVKEVNDVKRLIFNARLLTLTGPGGIGKTRLALASAHQLVSAFPDGVFFVNLIPIRDHEMVIREIARTLDINEGAEKSVMDVLCEAVMRKKMLLFIDNFEHVINAAPKIARLLSAAPDLHILITSREPLRIIGEQEYPVLPLGLPQEINEFAALQEAESVRLFVQSAQTVRPDFQLDTANAPLIVEICRRLDCVPLALELAAARVKLFTPQAILMRLDDRLKFLSSGSRDARDHQRTLRDSIDWSYSLLNADEQILFRRMSLFVGGCSLEALDSLCTDFSPVKLLNVLASLIDKSLVKQYDGHGGEPRFSMLETIREYAYERLGSSDEFEEIEQRFVDFYYRLIERAEYEVYYAEQNMWINRLIEEYDNIRTVIRYFKQVGELNKLQSIIANMGMYWQLTGHAMEGFQLGIEAIDAGPTPPAIRTKLLVLIGGAAYGASSPELGVELLEEALEIARREGDQTNVGWALGYLGLNYTQFEGESATVERYLTECLAAFRAVKDVIGQAWALTGLGVIVSMRGRYDESQRYQEESLSIYRRIKNHWGIMLVGQNLGLTYFYQKNYPEALRMFMRVVEESGDVRSAFPTSLVSVAAVYDAIGMKHESSVLLGVVEKILEPLGTDLSYPEQVFRHDLNRTLREELGEDVFNEAFNQGQRMNREQIIAFIHSREPV